MNCTEIEHKLPAYLDKDLSPGEMSIIEAHLQECVACKESFAAFALLEEALLERRSEVPPSSQLAGSMLPDSGLGRLWAALDLICRLPVMAGFFFIIFGLMLPGLISSNQQLFTRDWLQTDKIILASESIAGAIIQLSGGGILVLSAIYAGVAALILLSMYLMVIKFARDGG